MNFNFLTKNFSKKEKIFKKEASAINPNTYWRFILLLAFLIIISSIVFGFIVLNKIKEPFDPNNNSEIIRVFETLDKEKILQYLEYFKERENISNEIIEKSKVVSDPSV